MTAGPGVADASPPLADLRRAVDRCDAYEASWRAGGRPAIELILADFGPAHRTDLLLRLLELEIELRAGSGERPDRGEYLARFPEDAALIDLAFQNTPPLAAAALLPLRLPAADPPAILGDYKLLNRIGQGGMGVVYRAVQRSAGRVVALKLIRPDLLQQLPTSAREEAVGRFLGEARSVAAMTHDHIVTVHDVGKAAGHHYFAMQYVEGNTLAQVLAGGPLAGPRAAALLSRVARAVQYAHERGVLHRDLKPGNILVSVAGRPYVTDFGLAKRVDAGHPATPSGALLGTPAYLAPEVITWRGDRRFTPAGDIYSLGVTLYELVTGRVPFEAAEPVALFKLIVEEEPPAPSARIPGIDRNLETICLKCLRKDPRARYGSAGELADDLDRYLAGRSVHARPDGVIARARRWARRPWVRSAGAGLAALAVVAFLAIGLGARPPGWDEWRYRRATAGATAALAAGQEAQLVGPAEAHRYRWRAGRGDIRWGTTAAGEGELTVSTLEPSLLEFLPDPGRDDYEVSLLVRQEECYNAYAAAAIYVGHTPFRTAEGPQHGFVRVAFADLGPMAQAARDGQGRPCSRMDLGLMIYGASGTHPYRLLATSDPAREVPYLAPAPHDSPGPRRRMSVAVGGDRVSATCHWEGDAGVTLDPVRRWPSFLRQQAVRGHPELGGVTGLWRPRGGLGLYVYGCKVSVSSFAVRPTAPQ